MYAVTVETPAASAAALAGQPCSIRSTIKARPDQMIAVSWDPERKAWVNLMGAPVPTIAKLTHWGVD